MIKTLSKIDLILRLLFTSGFIVLAIVSHIIFSICITILHWVLEGNSIANNIISQMRDKGVIKGGKDVDGSDWDK